MSDKIVEGIILDIDVGYGLKYKDPDHIFTKLEIQMFTGPICVQLFNSENIDKLLKQLREKVRYKSTFEWLHHAKIYLLVDDLDPSMPKAIQIWRGDDWIYNNNWD